MQTIIMPLQRLKIEVIPVLRLYKNKNLTWTNIGLIDQAEVLKNYIKL